MPVRRLLAQYAAVAAACCLVGTACSVPPRRGIDKDVSKLQKSRKDAMELVESDPKGALPRLRGLESDARELASRLLIGDTRREAVDEILLEAVRKRRGIEEALTDDGARRERAIAIQAQAAVEDGSESKIEVRGRPDVDMSLIDKALGAAGGGGAAKGDVSRDADADFDSPEQAHLRRGEKEGDISEDEKQLRRRDKKQEKGPPKARPRFSEPVTVQKVEPKGKFVVVHVVYMSRGARSQVASVTGDVYDAKDESIGKIMGAYLAKGFKPDWDDIYESTGKWITPESFISAEAGKPLFMAAVAQCSKPGKAVSAKVTITTPGGHFRGSGP